MLLPTFVTLCMMGTVQSRKRNNFTNTASQDQQSQSTNVIKEEYVVIASDTGVNKPAVLEFNPTKSRAVCVGVDKHIGNNLGDVAAKNATLLSESFVTNMGMQKECVHVYTTDRVPYLCRKAAIKTHVLSCAGKVEGDGVFVFYFSGHVVVCKGLEEEDKWIHVLVPTDFGGDVKTGITTDDFVNWIQKANCKARHILIILDCCYAGGNRKNHFKSGCKATNTCDVCLCS